MNTKNYNLRNFLFAGLGIAMFAASCSTDKKTDTISDSSAIAMSDTSSVVNDDTTLGNCYSYIKNRDTASLTLKIAGEEVTGDLSYKLFEKDSNKGTIAGELKGDTIIAEYTFDSEGMRSVREVVFLNKDGKLWEGYGDVEQKGAKTIFKNRAALKFDTGMAFDKTDCK